MSRNGKNNKGGRPPGIKSTRTIERDEAMRQFRERVSKNTHLLFDSQFSLARGLMFLFRIDKEFVKTGEGKNGEKGFWKNKKPVQVTDPEEMRQFLEDEITNGDQEDEFDPAASYYFLTAKEPDNNAIDSLLDRTHGRAKSELEVNINLPQPIYKGLSEAPKKLPPKKVKATVISEHGLNAIQRHNGNA